MNLNQVTLLCANLERSCAFYQTLGLRLIVKNNHYARFECPVGETTFSLEQGNPIPGTIRLYFECEDVDQRYQELQSQGVLFSSHPEDKLWKWREVWCQDPDGHALCLFHAGENRKYPPWRISS